MHTILSFFLGAIAFVGSLFGVHQTPTQQQQVPLTVDQATPTSTPSIEDIQHAVLQQNETFVVKKILPDGTIDSGPYAGYQRFLVTLNSGDWVAPDSDGTELFALVTKDYKTYVLGNAQQYDLASPVLKQGNIFTANVVATGTVPFNQPPYIFSGAFVLERTAPFTGELTGSEKQLDSLASGLTFYAGTDDITVADSFGATFSYRLIPREMYEAHLKQPDFLQASYRNYYLTASEITTNQPLYKTYGDAFPGHCGYGTGSLLELPSLSDASLRSIGTTTYGATVYVPRSSTDALIQREFDAKITSSAEVWKAYGEERAPDPTLEEYAAKNPLLVLKDPWGRWVATGEWDYLLPGGCGKPVMYLYPEKDTEVSVRLDVPVDFTTQIPAYQDGWNVLAHSDGMLTDLQPEATSCSSFGDGIGSEYARAACLSNNYPYIYWSGNAYAKYPSVAGGWILPRQGLESFLQATLSRAGFSAKESNDFLSYWVPTMLREEGKYFQISFITTQEMNAFIPMSISPQPDSVYRLFMDWKPLQEKPAYQLPAQTLPTIHRQGFTVIEWGGVHP